MQKLLNKLISFLLLALPVTKKKKLNPLGFTTYTIKKGKHRSGFNYKVDYNNNIKFEVEFDESAIYKTKNPDDQADINKLYGFSDGGNHHMESSIRIGWRWYNDKLELLWFKHEEGKFSYGPLETINLNQTYICRITTLGNKYLIGLNNYCYQVERSFRGDFKHYYLNPYFGGNEKAPHDITIKIKH
jgi:hypothetical protein